jgi:lipoate-protein ligase A
MWSQTPRFNLMLDPKDDIGLQMEVHHGVIKSLEFEGSDLPDNARTALRTALVGMKLQHVWNSNMFRQISDQTQNDQLAIAARRLKALLPVPSLLRR